MLIVEDSPTSRELVETLLRSWSMPVVSVESAEDGLALLEQVTATGARILLAWSFSTGYCPA